MLQAELKRLHSPDVLDLKNHTLENPECFCVLVQAMVGIKDKPGEESFNFLVCTPNWLSKKISETEFVLGRHYLFVLKYDYNLLLQIIEELCHQAKGEDWKTIANYLGRYGGWEFEDYREE